MKSLEFKYQNLVSAYNRLFEAVKLYGDKNDIVRDSIIQRFEFTYELAWKTLKAYMEYAGLTLETSFPRSIFKEAYANKIIDDEKVWLKLLEDRNLTSHIYDEKLANEIADRIINIYIHKLGSLVKKLGELI
jgi:nucleotidyltransferase substrate binding protein (TIGR01987 family)